jgi:hypothetical protein
VCVNKVKITAMEALANLSSRGDAMVVTNLCQMLEDADTAVRNLGVRLLPLVTQEPEDTLAIDEVLLRLDHKRRFDEYPHWITEERDVRLAALKALSLIAPQGHDKTTRRVVALLQNSWSVLIRDFTGCARSAEEPHKGAISDYGFSRGPISLRAQLRAIEREAPCKCPAKCGEAAAAVRIAAIEVLVCISVRHTHLAHQRHQLVTAAKEAAEAKEQTKEQRALMLARAPSKGSTGKSPSGSAGHSASNSTSATPYSFSRRPSQPSIEAWILKCIPILALYSRCTRALTYKNICFRTLGGRARSSRPRRIMPLVTWCVIRWWLRRCASGCVTLTGRCAGLLRRRWCRYVCI